MPSYSTVTILSMLNTRNPESFKSALALLGEHFIKEWRNKAHSMVRKKLSDERWANSIITDDILNEAFILFADYLAKDSAHLPQNKIHVEAMFATNIRYAISETIRKHKKSRRDREPLDNSGTESESCGDSDSEKDQGNAPTEEYWNELESLFKSIETLSREEYVPGRGLDPVVLCERRMFLQESLMEIAEKYHFDRRTIARYWGDIARFLRKELTKECLPSDFGTRPMVAEIWDDWGENMPDLRVGDIIMSCNQRIFYTSIALKLHIEHMLERLRGNPELEYTCEIIVEQKWEGGRESVPYEISWNDWSTILKNVKFVTAEYDAKGM